VPPPAVGAAAAGGVTDDGFAFSTPAAQAANGSLSAGTARKMLHAPVLTKLRGLMIARMAKPEVRVFCVWVGAVGTLCLWSVSAPAHRRRGSFGVNT
jgi:hypothetical protein